MSVVAIFTGSPIFFLPFLGRHRRPLCRHHARMIPLRRALAARLPALITVALLRFLRRGKLRRRLMQATKSDFGRLPLHAPFLTTHSAASQA